MKALKIQYSYNIVLRNNIKYVLLTLDYYQLLLIEYII